MLRKKFSKKTFLCLALCLAILSGLLAGCGDGEDSQNPLQGDAGQSGNSSASQTLLYSNLIDQDTQTEVKKTLTDASIPEENADAFLALVNDYNVLIGELSEFHSGFTALDAPQVEYAEDTYEKWIGKRPYADANCRITALTLLRGMVTAKAGLPIDSFLVMDQDALNNYELCKLDSVSNALFTALFNPVPVDATTDSAVVLSAFLAEWKNRGLDFPEGSVSLVSVLMHSELDNVAYIGHAGVMAESADGVLFLEKLAPMAPYQVLKFQSAADVKIYLENSYGTLYTKDVSAPPVILKNDQAF